MKSSSNTMRQFCTPSSRYHLSLLSIVLPVVVVVVMVTVSPCNASSLSFSSINHHHDLHGNGNIFEHITTLTPSQIHEQSQLLQHLGVISLMTQHDQLQLSRLKQQQAYFYSLLNNPQHAAGLTPLQLNEMMIILGQLPLPSLLQGLYFIDDSIGDDEQRQLYYQQHSNQYYITVMTLYNTLMYNVAYNKNGGNVSNDSNEPTTSSSPHQYRNLFNKFNTFFESYYSLYPQDIVSNNVSSHWADKKTVPHHPNDKLHFNSNEQHLFDILTPLLKVYIAAPVYSTIVTSHFLTDPSSSSSSSPFISNNVNDYIETILLFLVKNYPFLTPTIIKATQYLSNETIRIGDSLWKLYPTTPTTNNDHNQNTTSTNIVATDTDLSIEHFFKYFWIKTLRLKITTAISNEYQTIIDISTRSINGDSHVDSSNNFSKNNNDYYKRLMYYNIADETINDIVTYYTQFLEYDEVLLKNRDNNNVNRGHDGNFLTTEQIQQEYYFLYFITKLLRQYSEKKTSPRLLKTFHMLSTTPYDRVNYESLLGVNNFARLASIPLSFHHAHTDDNNNNNQNTTTDINTQQPTIVSSISATEYLKLTNPGDSGVSLRLLKQISTQHDNHEIRMHGSTLFSSMMASIKEALIYFRTRTQKNGYTIYDDYIQTQQQHQDQQQQNVENENSYTKQLLHDLANRYKLYYDTTKSPKLKQKIIREYNYKALLERQKAEMRQELNDAEKLHYSDLNSMLNTLKKKVI